MSNEDYILAVSGLCRCGTSLMMKMLHVGGMGYFGDNEKSYETDLNLKLPDNHEFLNDCYGKAVKLLDPHKWPVPKQYNVKWVWMYRNTKEQARSQLKLVEAMGFRTTRKDLRSMEKQLVKDEATCKKLLAGEDVLRVRFEDLINQPIIESQRIADFTELLLDLDKMVSVVIPRETKCYKGFLELQ